MSITLHPTLGVNVRMTRKQCVVCLDEFDGDELVLLGIHNFKDTCPSCGLVVYGGMRSGEPCPKCGNTDSSNRTRVTLDEHERIQTGLGVCPKCRKIMDDDPKGVFFIQVRDGESGSNSYRTGKICALKMEAALRIPINSPELRARMEKTQLVYMEESVWQRLGLP